MATAIKSDPVRGLDPTVERPQAAGGKRRFVLPIVGVLALLGAFWAVKQWSYGRGHASTDDAAVDGHLIPVLAKVRGYVQTVNANDNNHVQANSVVVRIDPSEYKTRLAQADAELAGGRASAGAARARAQVEHIT